MTRARHGSYLFRRDGSTNWWVRLRSGNQRIEKSLRTSDRREAEILAAPMVAAHKAALLAARPHLEMTPYTLDPGEHIGPNGQRVIATTRELIYLDAAGVLIKTEPNGPALRLVNMPMGAVLIDEGTPQPLAELRRIGPFIDLAKLTRGAVPIKNGDDAILETYLKHANISGYFEREARTVWGLFRSLCDKPLKDADRDDGRKLVAYFESRGLKSATIAKKVGWLAAACNLAIKEGRLKFNPFASIVPERNDRVRRLPLSDADMRLIRRDLHKLSDFDQTLFRFLAATGMRLSGGIRDRRRNERARRALCHSRQKDRAIVAPRTTTGLRVAVSAEGYQRAVVCDRAPGPAGYGVETPGQVFG